MWNFSESFLRLLRTSCKVCCNGTNVLISFADSFVFSLILRKNPFLRFIIFSASILATSFTIPETKVSKSAEACLNNSSIAAS